MDKLQVVPATEALIRRMAPNLRQDDLNELQAHGYTDPLIPLLMGLHGEVQECVIDEAGEPVVAWGIGKSHMEGVGFVWLMATNEIETHKTEFIRRCRGLLPGAFEKFHTLTNFVDVRNTLHIRWLRWMGFTFFPKRKLYGSDTQDFYEIVRIDTCVHQ